MGSIPTTMFDWEHATKDKMPFIDVLKMTIAIYRSLPTASWESAELLKKEKRLISRVL